MNAAAHILLTRIPPRVAKAGTVCAFRELCVLAEGNCSNHTQIKTSQYREQGYFNIGTAGREGFWRHTHMQDQQTCVCGYIILQGCCCRKKMCVCVQCRHARVHDTIRGANMHSPTRKGHLLFFKEMQAHGRAVFIHEHRHDNCIHTHTHCIWPV